MRHRNFCVTLVAVVATVALARCAAAVEPQGKRPNIVFIYTDDQAPSAIGLAGHPQVKTPHLDALFRQGAWLKNAFTTTPVCSPSRASLLTSRYGSELGITDWLHPRVEPGAGLKPGTLTWVEQLRRAGYRTGLVGKWHLGLTDKTHPTKFGYEYFMGFREGGTSPKDPRLEMDGVQRKFDGLTPDILTDHAMRFIREAGQQPFCLSLHFRAPHAPWLPVAEEDWSLFKSLDPAIPNPDYPALDVARVKRMTREYLASVHSVDRNVGRLLKLLDDLRLADNTVVIFTSDHGYNLGHNGIWYKGNAHWVLTDPPPGTKNVPRGQRPNMFDQSIRVPTAVRWPGVVRPGTVIERTVSNLDWFPTLLEMAGVPMPEKATVRGRSIVPLLRGEDVAWDDDLYAEYSTRHGSRTHMRMYRTTRWKLVRDFLNPERDEFYDLVNDPAETNNLIHSRSPQVREAIEKLSQKVRAAMAAVEDPVAPPAADTANQRP